MSNATAPFIVVDSCDGGGSTTLRDRLAVRISAAGLEVVATANPSDGDIGRFIREILRGERPPPANDEAFQHLFVADRWDHIARVVDPARAAGKVVVCDRYELSTAFYYASTWSRDVAGSSWIARLQRAFGWQVDLPRPDLTIVLAVRAETAAVRRARRHASREFFDADRIQRQCCYLYWYAKWAVDRGGAPGYIAGRHLLDYYPESAPTGANLVVISGEEPADVVEARGWAYVEPVLARWKAAAPCASLTSETGSGT